MELSLDLVPTCVGLWDLWVVLRVGLLSRLPEPPPTPRPRFCLPDRDECDIKGLWKELRSFRWALGRQAFHALALKVGLARPWAQGGRGAEKMPMSYKGRGFSEHCMVLHGFQESARVAGNSASGVVGQFWVGPFAASGQQSRSVQSRGAKIYKGEEINEAMAEHRRDIARLLESGDP